MSTGFKMQHPVNYRGDDDSQHKYDYLSEIRADPDLHYFHDKLSEIDPATAHRLSHAALLLGQNADVTAERVDHVIDALRETKFDQNMDPHDAKQLAGQVSDALTSYHDRQREHLEFMQEHSDYQLPLTPRQQHLAKFEADLKRASLEYVKADNGDITVTFPNQRVRDQILSNQPEGFVRRVNKEELAQHKQNLAVQRELDNTWTFHAQDEQETAALQHNLLREEMDRRAKKRTDQISHYLENALADPDEDDGSNTMNQHQLSQAIAELLHSQFEDDNKTMSERLDDIPLPDPRAAYNLDAINQFTDPDMRNRIIGTKVDYDFQAAREAITEKIADLNAHDVSAAAATGVTSHMAQLYYDTLSKFAEADNAEKFAVFHKGSADTGQALLDRVQHGASLIEDHDFYAPSFIPPADPQADALERFSEYHTSLNESLEDADLPQHIALLAHKLNASLGATVQRYSLYLETSSPPYPPVLENLNREARRDADMLDWMLRK